jgi:hypothetical protein
VFTYVNGQAAVSKESSGQVDDKSAEDTNLKPSSNPTKSERLPTGAHVNPKIAGNHRFHNLQKLKVRSLTILGEGEQSIPK